jgi:MYXO-CTERM domain-containing protein
MKKALVKPLILLVLAGIISSAVAFEIRPRSGVVPVSMVPRITGEAHRLRSALDSPGNGEYRFTVTSPSEPAGWWLLLGGLLTGGLIVRRRVAGD